MLYDKYVGVPPRGTLLESVFVLIYLQRQEEQLLATRALVQASLSKEEQKPAIEAFEMYCSRMFPFLAQAAKRGDQDQQEALKDFVKSVAKISLGKVYKQQADAYQARRQRARAIPSSLRTFRQADTPPNASVLYQPPK